MTDDEARSKFVELRKKAGVTQKALADALGVTDHTVRNWEKGREEPRLFIWQVKRLCQLLNCGLDDLPDSLKASNAGDIGSFPSVQGDDVLN